MSGAVAAALVAKGASSTTVALSPPSTTVAAQGYTFVDRSAAIVNGANVQSIDVYSNTARTMKVKIAKRNASNNYDIVVDQSFSHAGGGWQTVTLSSSYLISGTIFFVAVYCSAGGANPDVSAIGVTRSYNASDVTGTGFASFAEDSSQVFPTRYTYT